MNAACTRMSSIGGLLKGLKEWFILDVIGNEEYRQKVMKNVECCVRKVYFVNMFYEHVGISREIHVTLK